MKKIFLAILLLGSAVPVSQFQAKTDELMCLHEPDSWFKKQLNSFLSFFGAKATSPKNSSHEILRVAGYNGDTLFTDNQGKKDQFMIDCYRIGDGKVKGNVVLEMNEKSEKKLTPKLIEDLLIGQKLAKEEAAKNQAAIIKTWSEIVSTLLIERDRNVFAGVNVPELAQYLEKYFKDAKYKDTAAYHVLGFPKSESNNEEVIKRYKFLKLHLDNTTAREQYNKLFQVIGDAIKQLRLQDRV